MKQSEKDKIFELIENCNTGDVALGRENYSVINMTLLNQCIKSLPIEPEEITEVYAIKDITTGEVIWNAHGCPYKYKEDAEKKISKLKCLMQNKGKLYYILTFKLEK